jgi:hypothetical protein
VGVPLYPDDHGRPSFSARRGAGRAPVLITTVPKSGTYLYAALLEALGVAPAGIHLASWGMTDYRSADERGLRAGFRELTTAVPLAATAPLVRPGQFAVGHIECTPEIRNLLDGLGYRVILVTRDLRACVVSLQRFLIDFGRVGPDDEGWAGLPPGPARTAACLRSPAGRAVLDSARGLLPWLSCPGVLRVSFEAAHGDHGAAAAEGEVDRVTEFLGLTGARPAGNLLRSILGRPTPTFSGRRSRVADSWDGAAEAEFVKLGGLCLQRQYGHPDGWGSDPADGA